MPLTKVVVAHQMDASGGAPMPPGPEADTSQVKRIPEQSKTEKTE